MAVAELCSFMVLHSRQNQPILSSVRWGSGESSPDSEEVTGSGRPLPCSLDPSIDSDDIHWTNASRTGIRKKNPYHTSRTVCECETNGLQQSDSRRKKSQDKAGFQTPIQQTQRNSKSTRAFTGRRGPPRARPRENTGTPSGHYGPVRLQILLSRNSSRAVQTKSEAPSTVSRNSPTVVPSHRPSSPMKLSLSQTRLLILMSRKVQHLFMTQ